MWYRVTLPDDHPNFYRTFGGGVGRLNRGEPRVIELTDAQADSLRRRLVDVVPIEDEPEVDFEAWARDLDDDLDDVQDEENTEDKGDE